jgi:hypothetical protein
VLWLVLPTLAALAAALAVGGSLRDMCQARIRAWPAIVSAFAIELILYNPPLDQQPLAHQVGPWIWVAARLTMLAAVIANVSHPRGSVSWPWVVIGVGLGLNTLVVAANGGYMPRSTEAALAVWGSTHIDPSRLQNVVAMGPATWLPWLGDVIPEPAWLPRPNVVSVGDVLLASGLASWVLVHSRPR